MKTEVEEKVAVRSQAFIALRTFIIAGLGGLFALAMILPGTAGPLLPKSPTVQELNQKFLTTASEYARFPKSQQSQKLTVLHQQAVKRREAMIVIAKTDTKKFFELAIPAAVRAKLPLDVQPLVETQANDQGKLIIEHADNFTNKTSVDQYMLVSAAYESHRTPVYFATVPITNLAGATVKLHGWQLDENILVAGDANTVEILQQPSVTTATGTKKVAVILFNFQNDPMNKPITVDQARQTIFTSSTSVNGYYKESSYNQLSLIGKNDPSGDIYGWVTIPFDSTSPGCNEEEWSDAADSIIGSTALAGYDYYIYDFPPNVCGVNGRGGSQMGGNRSWAIGDMSVPVAAHELGHNFGLNHAMSRSCTKNGIPVTVVGDHCTYQEYGDPFDLMGNGVYLGNGDVLVGPHSRHFSSFRNGFLGWYDPSNTVDVVTSGIYTLEPIETPRSGTKTLRVPQSMFNNGAPNYYYLEYRRPFGIFDDYNPLDPVVNGVSVRVAPPYDLGGGSHSTLLDANPATPSFDDSALASGETFGDTGEGISVQTIGVSATSATVSITLNCNKLDNPAFTFYYDYPVSTWFSPGKSTVVPVHVQSNDDAGCPPRQFQLNATPPSGWSVQPIPVITLAPHQPTTINVIITPASSAAGGWFSVFYTLSSMSPSGYNAMAQGSYVLDSTPPPTPTNLRLNGPITIASAEPTSTVVNEVTVAGAQISRAEISGDDGSGGGGVHAHLVPLAWDPSYDPDSGTRGYRLYSCIGTGCTPGNPHDLDWNNDLNLLTSYSFAAGQQLGTNGTNYSFEVAAYNSAGLESARSNRLTVFVPY